MAFRFIKQNSGFNCWADIKKLPRLNTSVTKEERVYDETCWAPEDGAKEGSVIIDLGSEQTFDTIKIEEYIQKGQRISEFTIEYMNERGQWKEFYSGKTIGSQSVTRHAPVTSSQIRITVKSDYATPILNDVGIYKGPETFELEEDDSIEFIVDESQLDYTSIKDATRTGTWQTADNTHFWSSGTNSSMGTVNLNNSTRIENKIVYYSDDIGYGEHTVELKTLNSSGKTCIDVYGIYGLNIEEGIFEVGNLTYDIAETDTVQLEVVRKHGSKGTATVNFSTTTGSAQQNMNYEYKDGTLEFADGETSKVIDVKIYAHKDTTSMLNFYLDINTAEGARLGLNTRAVINIHPADKTATLESLNALIAEAKALLDNPAVTEEAKAYLNEKIAFAEKAAAQPDAEQSVYGGATTALQMAIDNTGIDSSVLNLAVSGTVAFEAEDAKLEQAVDLIAANMPMSIHESVSPIVHHVNGVQNYRAVMALSAITGCYDRKGGNLPRYNTFSHMGAGFETKEHEFIHETEPKHHPPAVGAWRFPVFEKVAGYGQSMDLFRQIVQGTPYPIKVLVAFGLNFRMFPEDNRFSDVLEKLDFYVDVDLFWTDSASFADLVLPACSILERDEFKVVKGGKGYYVQALLDPLYDSRSDYDIIKGIADVLDLDDELLRSGYDQCIDHMLSNHGITAKELKQAARPVTMPGFRPYVPGTYTLQGYDTPTGKFELWSTVLEQYGYDPLPTYRSSLDDADPEDYPMILFTGSSIPNAYNSRLEHVESLRRLRPEPQADIGIGDARRMGISYGDMIKVSTPLASIELKANPSQMIKDGTISIYHGYRKADVNILIGADHLDPISGFCGFKSVRCRVERVMEEST